MVVISVMATSSPQVVEVGGAPRVLLVASREIKAGEEVAYDYGDRTKQSSTNFPWLVL